MQALDFLKAFGVAALLLVLNVAAAFGVMAIYGHLIEPGHDEAFYQAAANRIAPWSSVVVGSLLFLCAGWLFATRRPMRNALAFAAAFTAFYVAIDLAVIIAMGAFGQQMGIVLLSIVSKLAAALLGARVGRGSGEA